MPDQDHQTPGPKTEAGKQRSARNSLKHGAYSTKLLFWGSDEAAFHALEKDARNRFNPQGELEETIFYQLLAALWRLRQIPAADVSMVNIQMQRMAAATDAQFEALSPQGRYALAFNALAPFGDGPARLARQERRLHRQYLHYRQELEHLQATRPQPDPEPPTTQPDPAPVNEPVNEQITESDETNPLPNQPIDAPTNPNASLYASLPPLTPATPPAKEVAIAASGAS